MKKDKNVAPAPAPNVPTGLGEPTVQKGAPKPLRSPVKGKFDAIITQARSLEKDTFLSVPTDNVPKAIAALRLALKRAGLKDTLRVAAHADGGVFIAPR